MKKYIVIFAFSSMVFCSKKNVSKNANSVNNSTTLSDSIKQKAPDSTALQNGKPNDIQNLNTEILQILKAKDYEKLAPYIHPEKGVRFSMYGYIQLKKDKVFSKDEFLKYIPTNIKFTWGEKDGTGDLLQMSLKNYLEKWVFVKDFTQSQLSKNAVKGRGNTLNNIKEIYLNSTFTENYIKGTEEYSGMDWNILRLVFEEYDGKLFLVGIINDQWTI